MVTDVGSVKLSVVEAAGSILPHPCNFVGGHPMTGFRHRGVTFARADLFHGTNTILTPVSATRPEALELVRSLWEALKARVTLMSPAEHDEVVARVSHLPHAVAALLMIQAERDNGLNIAGPGLVDATRPAARDAELWEDILLNNRGRLREAIAGLIDDLSRLDAWLERREDVSVRRMLERAARLRDEWVARRLGHREGGD